MNRSEIELSGGPATPLHEGHVVLNCGPTNQMELQNQTFQQSIATISPAPPQGLKPVVHFPWLERYVQHQWSPSFCRDPIVPVECSPRKATHEVSDAEMSFNRVECDHCLKGGMWRCCKEFYFADEHCPCGHYLSMCQKRKRECDVESFNEDGRCCSWCGHNPEVEPQINGSNGEWTGLDDMPPVPNKKRTRKPRQKLSQMTAEKAAAARLGLKNRRAARNRQLDLQLQLIKDSPATLAAAGGLK